MPVGQGRKPAAPGVPGAVTSGRSSAPKPWDGTGSEVTQCVVRSAVLGNSRTVTLWSSPSAGRAEDHPVLVLLDGESFLHGMDAPGIFDQLFTDGLVRPFTALLVHNPTPQSRLAEYLCNPSLGVFVIDELLPQVRGSAPGEVSRRWLQPRWPRRMPPRTEPTGRGRWRPRALPVAVVDTRRQTRVAHPAVRRLRRTAGRSRHGQLGPGARRRALRTPHPRPGRGRSDRIARCRIHGISPPAWRISRWRADKR